MPQLDSNTFIYQYAGIITLLIAVYFILSYIVLPILLRLMLIRNLFLATRQTSTDLVNVVSNNYQQLVSLKNPSRNFSLTNNFIKSFTFLLSNWLTLLTTTLTSKKENSDSTLNLVLTAQESVTNYLILFLLIELEDNE